MKRAMLFLFLTACGGAVGAPDASPMMEAGPDSAEVGDASTIADVACTCAACNTCHDRERYVACVDGGWALLWCYQHPEIPLCSGPRCIQ